MSQHDEIELNPCWTVGCGQRLGHDGPCDTPERNLLMAEGERRILLEVAKLPTPAAMASPTDEQCLWCGVRWSRRRDTGWSAEPHPDNGCLWPRAVKAKEGR